MKGLDCMRLLVVESDKKLANLCKRGLDESKFEVHIVPDGESGLQAVSQDSYNLVILDAQLPKKDGISVVKELREKKLTMPVLMLGTKDSVDDVVACLNAGADDYIGKPFEFPELRARINAILRRSEQEKGAEIEYADMRLDPVKHKVWRAGKELDLTAKEYALLEFLMRNPNQVITRTTIAEKVWEDVVFDHFTNIIDVYVNYLRKKVDRGYEKKLIHTARGLGYIFKEED